MFRAAVPLFLIIVVPVHGTVYSVPEECGSCTGSLGTAYNNSACIALTWHDPQSVGSGSCGPPTACPELTKCTGGGSVTISNTGAGGCGDIYVRNRVSGTCIGGTTTLGASPPASSDQSFDDLTIACGSDFQVVIYTSSHQASNCFAAGAAGFSWTCTSCDLHH